MNYVGWEFITNFEYFDLEKVKIFMANVCDLWKFLTFYDFTH